MFTGLIQAQGIVRPRDRDRFAVRVLGAGMDVLADVAHGDSIAVDGVCLTVEELLPDGFVATASPETLRRTNLGQRAEAGDRVNLETSLRAGDKLGGHFVTGHVDGVGCLLESVPTEQAWELTFGPVPALAQSWHHQIARFLVEKGSIAANGISLTIAACAPEGDWFRVSIIPVTYQETNLSTLAIGDWVNLEGDILGKYVEKLLGFRTSGTGDGSAIDLAFLSEHGYL